MERQRQKSVKICLLMVLLVLFNFLGRISSLSVTVNDVECVYEYVLYEGDNVSGNFVVVDHDIFWSSDHPGIDFTGLALESDILVRFRTRSFPGLHDHDSVKWQRVSGIPGEGLKDLALVTSPAGNEVKTLKGTSGDKFEFKAPRSGMYKFCFHNPYSTPETVSFYIHVGHIPNEHDLAKDEHLNPLNVKIAELREALESVTAEQKYLKARDARHRRTNESTRKRVVFYTVGEYIMLAVASALQVIYIRQLFSKSVAYNRV